MLWPIGFSENSFPLFIAPRMPFPWSRPASRPAGASDFPGVMPNPLQPDPQNNAASASTPPSEAPGTVESPPDSTAESPPEPPGPEDPLHQPHDRLFRTTFSDPANAREFLKAHLPESVAKKLPWDRMEVVPCSFIDPALTATESDLVFKFFRGKKKCYLYVLLEHQSTEDPFMPCRLARYILRLWDRHRRDHPKTRRLPPVFPLVVYQGAAPWKSGKRLRDLIELEPGDPNARWQLDLEFSLMELFRTEYEELKGTEEGVLALRVLKAEPVGELLSGPVWELAKWRKISKDALHCFLGYIASRDKDQEALVRHIEQLKEPRLEEALMTIAEQYRAAGREEGIREGESRGESRGALAAKRRAVLRALEIRYGSGTNTLEPQIFAQVNAIESGPVLDQLLDAAICSGSIEDFERQLPRNQ